jgi:hypothetical protein
MAKQGLGPKRFDYHVILTKDCDETDLPLYSLAQGGHEVHTFPTIGFRRDSVRLTIAGRNTNRVLLTAVDIGGSDKLRLFYIENLHP